MTTIPSTRGSGQVARLLARRGWQLLGMDCRESMVAFLRDRAESEGLQIEARCGDMTGTFAAASEFAAAYNPMSSFRLLLDDASADAHLRSMTGVLRPDGIYVLDMDFVEDLAAPSITTDETWEMSRDSVTVRAENDAVYVRDDGVDLVLAWGEETHLRGYTSQTLLDRVRAAGGFRVETWHPESGRNEEGVSQFAVDLRVEPPVVGRTMVVLRRSEDRA